MSCCRISVWPVCLLLALWLCHFGVACAQQRDLSQPEYDVAFDIGAASEIGSNDPFVGPAAVAWDGLNDNRWGTFTTFFGTDGSKQPQDFGGNANLGGAFRLGYSAPLIRDYGIGFQIGSQVVFSGNAVQVFELLGESKDRFQSFTTVGLFQRNANGMAIGAVYDFVTQESFDNFTLGQWRVGASFELNKNFEVGVVMNLSDRSDDGDFNSIPVTLDPIEQIRIYFRQQWSSGVQTGFWLGVADRHSEENVLTGTLPPKTNQAVFGAEIFAPLNEYLAISGETNLVMPADTGAVDAFLGIEFAPGGIRRTRSRTNRFRALLPVASSPSFTTDITRR